MVRRALLPTAVVAAVLVAVSCSRNPVTGKRELSLISEEQEIALGKQAAEEIVQTMGAYPDPEVQRYVERIGMRMAKASERPNLPWSFTVIDDPMVNAFALPGGPIFVTRGILSHLNSEAELATVLGHEIGHVTARHSVEQISKAQLAQLGLGVGQVFSETLRGVAGQAAGAGLQLLFLRFGRDAERQSDALGYKYMVEQGYDPREMDDVFATLERASGGSSGALPSWLSTHPDPGERQQTAQRRAKEVADAEQRRVDRAQYLDTIAGMTFGEDPRQGYFRGNTFLHPNMKFQLQLPEGWQAQNTPAALSAIAPGKDGAVQLSIAGKLSPDEATQKFFGQDGVRPLTAPAAGVPGTARYFEAQTEQGVLRGIISFISHGGATLQVVGFAPAERLQAYDATFRSVLSSFGPLTDPAALSVKPAQLQIVKVPRDMTIAEFAAHFPSTVPPERLALINGVEEGGRLQAGQLAKTVVGGVMDPKASAAAR